MLTIQEHLHFQYLYVEKKLSECCRIWKNNQTMKWMFILWAEKEYLTSVKLWCRGNFMDSAVEKWVFQTSCKSDEKALLAMQT